MLSGFGSQRSLAKTQFDSLLGWHINDHHVQALAISANWLNCHLTALDLRIQERAGYEQGQPGDLYI